MHSTEALLSLDSFTDDRTNENFLHSLFVFDLDESTGMEISFYLNFVVVVVVAIIMAINSN
jgi:hypothetical protein